jgi:hypothetical protein
MHFAFLRPVPVRYRRPNGTVSRIASAQPGKPVNFKR